MPIQECLYPAYKITLQAGLVPKSFFFDTQLAVWTAFPSLMGRFIPAYMDIFRREELHHFRQDIFEKFESRFLSYAQFRIDVRLA